MPVEYTGSMIVFLVVMGTSLVRPMLQLAFLAALVVYCMWQARWEWCLFISGVLIADMFDETPREPAPIPLLPLASRLDEEVDENASHLDEEAEGYTSRTRFVKGWAGDFKSYKARIPNSLSYIIDCLFFLFALYLEGAPTGNPDGLALAPGFGWLSPMIPRSWGFFMGYFYPDIGAIILVSILARSNFLQKIFNTRDSAVSRRHQLVALYAAYTCITYSWEFSNCKMLGYIWSFGELGLSARHLE